MSSNIIKTHLSKWNPHYKHTNHSLYQLGKLRMFWKGNVSKFRFFIFCLKITVTELNQHISDLTAKGERLITHSVVIQYLHSYDLSLTAVQLVRATWIIFTMEKIKYFFFFNVYLCFLIISSLFRTNNLCSSSLSKAVHNLIARNIITGLLNTVINVFTHRYTIASHTVLTIFLIFFYYK